MSQDLMTRDVITLMLRGYLQLEHFLLVERAWIQRVEARVKARSVCHDKG